MAKPSVGYIGLGNAGYPMAACLAKKGYKLLVHDSNDTTARNFVTEFPDCRMASRADGTLGREVFSECEIAITMLPDGKIVREALLGENGIAWGLKPGSIVVDISSSSPFDTQSLGRELEDLSITLIDSPITQRALHSIDTGGATLMVGSNDAAALGRALPVLQDMSSHVFSMGVLGAGHTMKTLNNYVSVGSIIALCDALVTGKLVGLDPQTMIDVMNVGTGVNFSTSYSMKALKSFNSGYSLDLLVKDVKIAKNVIEKAGFYTAFPELAIKYLGESLELVEKGACHSECIRSWERRAGVEIEKTGSSGNK